MKELQDAGIEFALDDFGTGYASFRYMQHLPITKVKIDKLFIDSLTTQPKTQQLVEGMIRFCKSMGLYTIAEGVETKEQYELLEKMGADAVQGYYIGMPVTSDNIQFKDCKITKRSISHWENTPFFILFSPFSFRFQIGKIS